MSQTPFHKPANIINHIVLSVDESLSMKHLKDVTVRVFDNFIAHLAASSRANGQETRVSVYFFNSYGTERCVIWDMDVLRVPSLAGLYHPTGNTALLRAFMLAMGDIELVSQKYGDHSFLVMGFTDGEENHSVQPYWDNIARARLIADVGRVIATAPENVTCGLMVPNQAAVHEAKRFGFPAGNISIWDPNSEQGIEEAGRVMREVADLYMAGRAQGVRGYSASSGGSRGLFQVRDFTAAEVTSTLTPLARDSYVVLTVPGGPRDTVEIRPFVEGSGLRYAQGCAFYQPVKAVKVQSYKGVIVEHEGRYYTGEAARQLLGLPSHDVTVNPGHKPGMTIFFQSTSVNRKLFGGTRLVVRL